MLEIHMISLQLYECIYIFILYSDHHHWHSPQAGSDIDYIDNIHINYNNSNIIQEYAENHAYSYLHCYNQSVCIEPHLQLREKVKIYFCKHPVCILMSDRIYT